jgi:hypothetical protein
MQRLQFTVGVFFFLVETWPVGRSYECVGLVDTGVQAKLWRKEIKIDRVFTRDKNLF